MTQQSRPAMTMREIRESLGHIKPGIPEPTVQPTGYVVSCLPAGHDDRWTFTIQVKYTGDGLFAVRHGIRQYGTDGTWSYEPDFDEDYDAEAAWLKEHRFEHDEALRLAKQLAPTLTYRGRTVADVLAAPVEDAAETHVVADDSDDPEHVDDCPGCVAAPVGGEDTRSNR